jgi:hypothetical protein
MATLTQLYTRLILDLNRDDMGSGGELEQAKIDAVAAAIDKNAAELFWFNRYSGTLTTVANTATVAFPAGLRDPKVVSYLAAPLRKVALEDIQAVYNATTPLVGIPSSWAEDEGNVRFFPTPNAVYALPVYGTADLGVPGSTNEWTTEAYELILAEAKVTLCRGPLRDVDGLALAKDGRKEALAELRRETRSRAAVAATTDLPVPQRYNINSG